MEVWLLLIKGLINYLDILRVIKTGFLTVSATEREHTRINHGVLDWTNRTGGISVNSWFTRCRETDRNKCRYKLCYVYIFQKVHALSSV